MKTDFAEFLGTFMLMVAGTGTMALTNADPLTIGLAFGGMFAVATYALAPFTLGEFNPAISIALAIKHQLTWTQTVYHIFAQLFGAILSSGFIYLATISLGNSGMNIGQTTSDLTWPMLVLVEALFTFLLVFVYLQVKDAKPRLAGLLNGLTLTTLYVSGYALTGPALNPARSIGPALYVGGEAFLQLGFYLLATVIGAVLAAYVQRTLNRK